MADAKDYLADVKKYAADCNEAAVGAIVKHLGIALRNRDSSLVSGSDPDEVKRVRDSWCKKKLGVTDSDQSIDGAIKSVLEKMKADRTKHRVTVYYLLAAHYNKLDSLIKK